MASTEATALIVALIALIVSVLQVVQQYASAAVARAKVNRAAVGHWSTRNRYSWSIWEWKLQVEYLRPYCPGLKLVEAIGNRCMAYKEKMATTLPEFDFTLVVETVEQPGGERTGGSCVARTATRSWGAHKVSLRGDESRKVVEIWTLSSHQKALLEELKNDIPKPRAKSSSHKATWCNLFIELGLDLMELSGDQYVDADTLATSLDAPTMHIRMSDLILYGFLLDMEINHCEPRKRIIDMIGEQCDITTQYQEGVGMLARYSCWALQDRWTLLTCSTIELASFVHTAHGELRVANFQADLARWGFNSIDLVLSTASEMCEMAGGEELVCQEIIAKDSHVEIAPDFRSRWDGKWNKTTVPVTAFLLSLCDNMAVASAFPHRHLLSWPRVHRRAASKVAYQRIFGSVGFLVAPTDLFQVMKAKNIDLIVMGDLKANDWGFKDGGMHGWIFSNFAMFTHKLHECWSGSNLTDQVPILPQLKMVFASGGLGLSWGRYYNANLGPQDKGPQWCMRVNCLLWLQVMMFDAWIARKVMHIMQDDIHAVVTKDIDLEVGNGAGLISANNLLLNAQWKSSLAFGRHYLKQLVEGVDGKAVSCMSVVEDSGDLGVGKGWDGMPMGKADDWANVDAVLTLRAIAMGGRLELMKDSSALLDLKELDPMVQMA